MTEKYATYSLEDFLKDERFIGWVNAPTKADDAFFAEVIVGYPGQQPVMAHARQLVSQLSEASAVHFPMDDIDEIWDGIDTRLAERHLDSKPKHWLLSFRMAAASVALLLALGWAGYSLLGPDKAIGYSKLVGQSGTPLKEVVNQGAQTLEVALPDGSRVFLASQSKLSYARDFTRQNRDVYLSGEAFFDVAKNPEKPFTVYANELVTRVLGTSFTIRAFEQDSRVTVAVKTGRVSVFANRHQDDVDPETKGIILIPNQQADFQRESETISRSLVDQPRVVIAKKDLDKFNFNDAPVTQVFDAMENAYGVDFLFDREALASCRVTTSLSEETLFERLDVVCEAVGATYKVVDAQIVISGKKCD
nr:FecR domain-containing protein [uncultured Dyadobacter sp.]